MKSKIVYLAALIMCAALFIGCADPKVIDGVKYDTYGLFNEAEKRNSDIQYEISSGNVIWGIILSETIIAPIYFFGFSLYEPIGKMTNVKGAIPQ